MSNHIPHAPMPPLSTMSGKDTLADLRKALNDHFDNLEQADDVSVGVDVGDDGIHVTVLQDLGKIARVLYSKRHPFPNQLSNDPTWLQRLQAFVKPGALNYLEQRHRLEKESQPDAPGSPFDLMKDVYLSRRQREAYELIEEHARRLDILCNAVEHMTRQTDGIPLMSSTANRFLTDALNHARRPHGT